MKTHYETALARGIHATARNIETRRFGKQWHAPLRSFDAEARTALALGKVVRNAQQGFDVFPAGPKRFNVRFAPAAE